MQDQLLKISLYRKLRLIPMIYNCILLTYYFVPIKINKTLLTLCIFVLSISCNIFLNN